MEHYVTYFNSLFLPQGLALHISMERNLSDYLLNIICLDEKVYSLLDQINLPNVKLLRLNELETDDLLSVKMNRTTREYCWTLTPFAPRYVLEANPEIERVTYLDADLWFRKNPNKIFEEFEASGKSVLITDHAYAPQYDKSAISGQYCVQFIIFTRQGGEVVRKWWERKCIEWCYAKEEDGKFGDQKYLDHWPILFPNLVHVLQNKELTLAPWNSVRFPYGNAVFFHFHGLRILSKNQIQIGGYKIPDVVLKYVYKPYIADLKTAATILESIGFTFTFQTSSVSIFKKAYRKFSSILFEIKINLIVKDYLHW